MNTPKRNRLTPIEHWIRIPAGAQCLVPEQHLNILIGRKPKLYRRSLTDRLAPSFRKIGLWLQWKRRLPPVISLGDGQADVKPPIHTRMVEREML